MFRIPSVRLAEAQRPHQPRTYMYLFVYESPARRGSFGACHALELPFMFGTLDAPTQDKFAGTGPVVEQLSQNMMDSWLAFTRMAAIRAMPASVTGTRMMPNERATMLFGRSSASNARRSMPNAPPGKECCDVRLERQGCDHHRRRQRHGSRRFAAVCARWSERRARRSERRRAARKSRSWRRRAATRRCFSAPTFRVEADVAALVARATKSVRPARHHVQQRRHRRRSGAVRGHHRSRTGTARRRCVCAVCSSASSTRSRRCARPAAARSSRPRRSPVSRVIRTCTRTARRKPASSI